MKKNIVAILVLVMSLTLFVSCNTAPDEETSVDIISSESESESVKDESESISSSSESSIEASSEVSQIISKGNLSVDKFKEVCLKYFTEDEFTHEAEYNVEEEISETYMFEKGNIMISLAVFEDVTVIDEYFETMKEEFSSAGTSGPVMVDDNIFTVEREGMSAYMRKFDNVILAMAYLDEDGKAIVSNIMTDLEL